MPDGRHALRIGIIAGESSGDTIAADLIAAIRQRVPDAVFTGIAGPRMQAAGCVSLAPMEQLSVMGLAEVLGHLPGLLALRRRMRRHFIAERPDIFIGVDAPDFNLGLERRLKQAGIPVLHYVSPSVWAWRQYRVRKIAASTDCILTLFPFEERFYHDHDVQARFVGHPLADRIADTVDRQQARDHLQLDHADSLVALLPGSRVGEVRRLAPDFIRAAAWCAGQRPDLRFVVPLATPRCRQAFEQALADVGADLPLTLLDGQGLEAMAAADAVLLASGTATLECLLLKRPMAVAYRVAPLTYQLARRLVRTGYFALPNLLADRPLVREFIQHAVTAENLGRELLALLTDTRRIADMMEQFNRIHATLRRDASQVAADTVLQMTGRGAAGNGH
ncbi:MAG: lipid-A-disaccharide synthase [Halobacteria archaeon]|nr:lipid-A-disaccharide synthase [Halobacteria archaeon]